MSQITIAIPDDTNRQLSVAAQASGLTIEQFVHELILEGIAQRQADEQDAQEALSLYHEVTNTNQVYPAEAVAEYMRAKLTDPNSAGPAAIKWRS
jgi:hypothetical protein